MVVGPYLSLSRFWPASWRVYVSATQFSGGIFRQNGWHSHGRTGSANSTDTQALAGGGAGGARGGGTTGGGRFGRPGGGGGGSQQKQENDGDGGPRIGGPGGRGWKRWSPPSPDPRHPKIAAMMNPYLELSNGVLSLPRILNAGKIGMDDLPGLDKYKDPTTGRHIFCWAEVLGPCHFPECTLEKKGGTPSGRITSASLRSRWFRFWGRGLRPGWWKCVHQMVRELKWSQAQQVRDGG